MNPLLRVQTPGDQVLAAVAAAILGAQGSPVWSRTAEALLLADPEIRRLFGVSAREVDRELDSA